MTIKLASIETDLKAEADGEWVPVKEWVGLNPDEPFAATKLPGLEFQVRSLNHHGYKAARQKAAEDLEQRKNDYPGGVIPDDVAGDAEGRIIADHLLLGWKGFDVEYSREVAATALPKPASRTLRQMVLFCANKVGKRQVEFITTAADNLGK